MAWTARCCVASAWRANLATSSQRSLHLRYGSMFELKNDLKNTTSSQTEQWQALDTAARDRTLPRSQTDLPVKAMRDSHLESFILLSCDSRAREKYLTAHNHIRFGRLLEDLDLFAVACSYAHCATSGDAARSLKDESFIPRANVTAAVEHIDVRPDYRQVDNTKDICVSGSVIWVGTSSMAVNIHVSQDADATSHKGSTADRLPLLDALFVIVSRHPFFGRACPVPRITALDDSERRLLALGEAVQARRRHASEQSLLRKPPTADERFIIHDLFLSTLDSNAATIKVRHLPAGAVWMEDTVLKNIAVCFPEQRNIYGKIFGGFLMRQAYELGWAAACLHSGATCLPVAVDDISFEVPVDIGSFLFVSAQVVYTNGSQMQVKVHTEVVDVHTRVHKTTNIFHFTFAAVNGANVKTVLPKSYAESMMYLAGKRHFNKVGLQVLHQGGGPQQPRQDG